MKLLFKRKNNVSFLSEIGRQKRVVSVNVDKYTKFQFLMVQLEFPTYSLSFNSFAVQLSGC